MPREFLTEERVEQEIERLTNSEAVKLARREQRIKYRRRQQMYTLRALEKRGKQLMAEGVTMEALDILDSTIAAEDAGEFENLGC
jgi:hypothetical protein